MTSPTGHASLPTKLILVLGATGYTGRLITAHLLKKGQPFAIAGRSLTRLIELQTSLNLPRHTLLLEADPTRPETLTALFRPEIGVIINCVGPYTTFGEPVVRAAVEAGIHYLDLSGEQAYLAHIIEKYAELARQKGCAIIPGCGLEYTMTNWAAALAAQDLEPLESLWTATATGGVKTSQGTKLSLFQALAKPGLSWKDGRVAVKSAASTLRKVNFPPPFGPGWTIWAPFGELVTIPRHIKVQNMASFMRFNRFLALILWLFSPLLPLISRLAGPFMASLAKGPPPGYSENSRWAVVAQAEGKRGQRQVTIKGKNVYELTAVITAWCAARLLQPDFKLSGTPGPAQAFEALEALTYLSEYGVSWEIQ
jgi:short subunit dehydrogenase-like uncharacterized protein